jgi:neutral ceramidase
VLALAKQVRCDTGEMAELQARREELRFKGRVDVTNPFTKMALSRAFFPGLVAYYEREFKDGVRPDLTVALLNDQIGFVGVSGEFFCDHAMGLKRRARLPHLLFLGYCNDYHQYYPTIEAAAEGGYGTQVPEANAEPGAGERVADRALLLLYRMRGKIPE